MKLTMGGIGADMFAMGQDSGELTVKQELDREKVPDGYKIQIQVRDNYRQGTISKCIL